MRPTSQLLNDRVLSWTTVYIELEVNEITIKFDTQSELVLTKQPTLRQGKFNFAVKFSIIINNQLH